MDEESNATPDARENPPPDASEALGGICCLYVPCTAATLLFGLLGLTEETPQGNRRDGTLAKWSLFITAGCWGMVLLLFLLNALLHK